MYENNITLLHLLLFLSVEGQHLYTQNVHIINTLLHTSSLQILNLLAALWVLLKLKCTVSTLSQQSLGWISSLTLQQQD